jgi:hypothetical protein
MVNLFARMWSTATKPVPLSQKKGTKIDSVNVVTEASTHQGREMRQTTSSCNENIITYLGDRLRNLEAGKRESDDTVRLFPRFVAFLQNLVLDVEELNTVMVAWHLGSRIKMPSAP